MAEEFQTRRLVIPGKSFMAKSVPLVMPNNTEFNLELCSLTTQKGL